MVARTTTGRSGRRLVTSALLLGGLIAGGVLIAPEVATAAHGVGAATGGDHGENPPPRRANESGMIGDIRTVISAEAHRCHKDCNHDAF